MLAGAVPRLTPSGGGSTVIRIVFPRLPLNAVSTAGMVAGTGLMMASRRDLASHAGGDDHVSPAQSSEGASQDVGSAQDPQHFQDLGLDPATGQFRLSEAQTASRIENETGVRLDRSTAARDLIG